MKKLWFKILLISFSIGITPCFAQDIKPLFLNSNQSYVLSFDNPIQDIETDNNVLKTEVLNSIFNDKQQMVMTYIGNKPVKLRVKTISGNNYDYNVQYSKDNQDNGEILNLDEPPFIPKTPDNDNNIDTPPSGKE